MSELIAVKSEFTLPEIKAFIPKIKLVQLSTSVNPECHINASNDLAAISVWLNQHKGNRKTFTAYQREAERLVL